MTVPAGETILPSVRGVMRSENVTMMQVDIPKKHVTAMKTLMQKNDADFNQISLHDGVDENDPISIQDLCSVYTKHYGSAIHLMGTSASSEEKADFAASIFKTSFVSTEMEIIHRQISCETTSILLLTAKQCKTSSNAKPAMVPVA